MLTRLVRLISALKLPGLSCLKQLHSHLGVVYASYTLKEQPEWSLLLILSYTVERVSVIKALGTRADGFKSPFLSLKHLWWTELLYFFPLLGEMSHRVALNTKPSFHFTRFHPIPLRPTGNSAVQLHKSELQMALPNGSLHLWSLPLNIYAQWPKDWFAILWWHGPRGRMDTQKGLCNLASPKATWTVLFVK